MKKPLIGIVPLMDYSKESMWMLPGYMEGVIQAGGIPIMLPLTDDAATLSQLVDTCDGILITGGQDVSPALYGETIRPECKELCPERDRMEQVLVDLAVRADKPLLGICRGIQILNAVLGGTLYQDLPTQHPSDVEHHMTPPYDRLGHTVSFPAGSPLEQVIGQKAMAVNSYHHQAIKGLSSSLLPMAVAEDGIIEAVFMPGRKFVWAVQWHPEFSYKVDENSRKLFSAFTEAAGPLS